MLSVAVSSYNQNLYYGVTYDMQAAPDGELFRDFIVESYEQLRAAAGVPAVHAAKPAAPARTEPVSPADLRAHREQAAEPLVRVAAAAADAVGQPPVAEPPVVTPVVPADRPLAAAPAGEPATAPPKPRAMSRDRKGAHPPAAADTRTPRAPLSKERGPAPEPPARAASRPASDRKKKQGKHAKPTLVSR